MSFTIVVDENIPFARETFGRLGSLTLLPGRAIGPAEVRHADALLVRSVTRVGRALLDGSRVKFVGTATIGVDHVDTDYLSNQRIAFASAPGSNANSVAEYVIAALLLMAAEQGSRLEGAVIGVVGVGNVGSRVVAKAQALGMKCVLNDPPKQRATGDPKYLPLPQVLAEADYVTVHVPLEHEGPDATVGMCRNAFFAGMKPGACFINTSRGKVVDEVSLVQALDSGRIRFAVLDVWQNEPQIDPRTVAHTFLGTPHIAGYSFDGKVTATAMLYVDLCRYLGKQPELGLPDLLPPSHVPCLEVSACDSRGDEEVLRALIPSLYDIRKDDEALRRAVSAGEKRGIEFDLLRKNYPIRREFFNTTLVVPAERQSLAAKGQGLGFRVVARG
ncbi:MAG TPA: 4-phosphoerythronate dehydrogenase [Acidobacteriota bacterium]|jgi:erythronate-4-phosphate dehydrogenase|nr:4-phosphoerythronate dehydrogenase [Acidobacteriota bacterium]